jgi:DNA-binding transcriptional regulator LsrR (DeoR family)
VTRAPTSDERLAQVATLYYEQGLRQSEIAERLGESRSNVSRLLTEARRRGIVEIRIHRPLSLDAALAGELRQRFGLRDALVLADGEADALRRVGELAARFLERSFDEIGVLAISWGTALREVVEHLGTRRRPIEVVQMIGGVGSGSSNVDGTELARRFADALGGSCDYLHAPLLADDEETARRVLRESSVRRVLEKAALADAALVGIGALEPEVSSLVRAGYLDERAVRRLRRAGAVGDVCGRHFDAQGRVADVELNRRVVGLDLDSLRRIPLVIGVAAGPAKAEAIRGALRGGHLDVLVTDAATAASVLA